MTLADVLLLITFPIRLWISALVYFWTEFPWPLALIYTAIVNWCVYHMVASLFTRRKQTHAEG